MVRHRDLHRAQAIADSSIARPGHREISCSAAAIVKKRVDSGMLWGCSRS
jgi:hypothetical protein